MGTVSRPTLNMVILRLDTLGTAQTHSVPMPNGVTRTHAKGIIHAHTNVVT